MVEKESLKARLIRKKCTVLDVKNGEMTITIKKGCPTKLRDQLKDIIFRGRPVNFVIEKKED